ncbi:MAG: GGDEF domain-containing protein [Halomonadaceae bacterium]|nr:MAG: GGDEF domain-containing protein [Halomonadaceae bacterium]
MGIKKTMNFNPENSQDSSSHAPPLDESDTALRPFTAGFCDSALETAFQEAQQHQVQRIMAGFAVVGLLGVLLSGYGTYLHFGTSSWIFQGGLWLRLPLAVLTVAAIPVFLSQPNWMQLYALHTLLLVWGCITIALRMTIPYEGDETLLSLFNVSRDGVLLLLILSLYTMTLIPGWFITNVVIMTMMLTGFLLLAKVGPTEPDNLSRLVLVSISAFAFILATANAVRRLWRHTYLAHRRLHTANQKLEHLAQTDELTGCANRRYFFSRGGLEFEKALRYNWPLSVIAIDIDHFKTVNDQYGHASGDRVLEAFAALLRRNLREIDLPARIGGEEFVILLPGTDGAGAHLLAERLRRETEISPVTTDKGPISIKASFGVADIASTGNTDFDGFISAADTALYQAKKRGRNRVVGAMTGGVYKGEQQDEHESGQAGPGSMA